MQIIWFGSLEILNFKYVFFLHPFILHNFEKIAKNAKILACKIIWTYSNGSDFHLLMLIYKKIINQQMLTLYARLHNKCYSKGFHWATLNCPHSSSMEAPQRQVVNDFCKLYKNSSLYWLLVVIVFPMWWYCSSIDDLPSPTKAFSVQEGEKQQEEKKQENARADRWWCVHKSECFSFLSLCSQ